MSLAAERRAPTGGIRSYDPARIATALLLAVALGGPALLLLVRYAQRVAVPLSWERPSVGVLFLLPAAPVLGLLARRLRPGGLRRSGDRHLVRMTSRWAAVWAGSTAVWLVATVAGLYDLGLSSFAVPDNLAVVMASSDVVVGQLIALWVALLIALFGPRLTGRSATAALLTLSAAALLSALPAAATTPGHDVTASPVVTGLAGLEVVGIALWLGAVVVLLHGRTPLHVLRGHLVGTGSLLSAAGLLLGVSVALAGLFRPEGVGATPPGFAVAQLAAVVLLTGVGLRHRRRTVAVGAGRGRALPALLVSEVVVLVAVLLLAGVLPIAG